MRTIRVNLAKLSVNYHGYVHLLFGLFTLIFIRTVDRNGFSSHALVLTAIAVVASFLPDVDHLFFMYIYGRKSDYAKALRSFLNHLHVKSFLRHIKDNHKYQTGIYSHNLGSVVLSAFFTYFELVRKDNIFLATFFLAWTLHYIYDLIEDLLFFKKPNRNWYFKFNR